MNTGDQCQQCEGHLTVYTSKRRQSSVVQYLSCWCCGWRPKPNKIVLKSESIPRRRPRQKPA